MMKLDEMTFHRENCREFLSAVIRDFRGILQLLVLDGASLMIATDGDVDYRLGRSNEVTNLL